MTKKLFRVLLIDDEVELCELLSENIESLVIHNKPLEVDFCHGVDDAKKLLINNAYDVVFTDFNLNNETGLELVSHVVDNYPTTPIIVLSAYSKQEIPHIALKVGAFDFISKPIRNNDLVDILNSALKPQADNSLQSVILGRLIGNSEKILKFKSYISRIAKTQVPVFIRGESGTGKEVVSKIIHDLSSRSDGEFVAINCGAIPEQLLESELFGHKKGSFTGATSDKIGLIKKADKGTLFLDEIGELPLSMQVKLLRAIQEKKIRPIGSDVEIPVDFRLVSATHQNIEEMISKKAFRKDLFYRICVMDANIPPLRDRGSDIILLAEYFVEMICRDWGIPKKELSSDFKAWLLKQPFDGNVRELINLIQKATALSDGHTISLSYFDSENLYSDGSLYSVNQIDDPNFYNNITENPIDFENEPLAPTPHVSINMLESSEVYVPENLDHYLHSVEKLILEEVCKDESYSSKDVAIRLGLTMRQFRYKLQKHGLHK